ncbi:DMT family transporter [Oceanicola sp. S124]|uniref:DMT family transporter n=1 Tax=Oceanicola sp. S124 TaxID=1042378 RepID=UPI0002557A38|nr:DMT family transporter [Oceanicola sp. S124]
MTQTARAILLMILAVFCFSTMDACAKAIAAESNTVMALWARYAGQTVLVLALVAPRLRQVARTNFPGLQLMRAVCQLTATSAFFFGLNHLGLAESTAIMDVNPVLITLAAALFLGERLGPRRLLAIGAALVGAMIIIRPGTEVFSPAAVFPLTAALAYTGFSVATRYIGGREDPWTSLLYSALLGAVILTAILPSQWQMPSPKTALLMLVLAGLGTTAQLLLIRALTLGEAAMLAPFSYAGLISATFWGIVIFGEYPDRPTVIGALVIVAAGVYVWHRETRAARAPGLASVKAAPAPETAPATAAPARGADHRPE